MIRLDIPEDLRIWQPVIERQINMTLSPVRASLKNVRVRFQAVYKRGLGSPRYLCELSGRGVSGTVYEATAQHPDGHTAIVDAFARARRAIARDRQRRRQSG